MNNKCLFLVFNGHRTGFVEPKLNKQLWLDIQEPYDAYFYHNYLVIRTKIVLRTSEIGMTERQKIRFAN